jgi:excisionase family DNA binding protein
VQAFANHLGVQDKTVMKWIKAGTLPAYQFKGQ